MMVVPERTGDVLATTGSRPETLRTTAARYQSSMAVNISTSPAVWVPSG